MCSFFERASPRSTGCFRQSRLKITADIFAWVYKSFLALWILSTAQYDFLHIFNIAWQLIMQINIRKPEQTLMLPWRLLADKMSSALDVINLKRLLREAHRQQVAAMATTAAPRPPQWPGSSKGNCRRATDGREQERLSGLVLGGAETAHRSLDIRVFIHKFRVISVRKWCKYLNLIMNWVPAQDNVWQIGRQGRRQAVAPKLLW